MFSSKFLSGANPLNAVSSAVNKFGLFGDDSEGDKKSPPQQGPKQSGQQKPVAGSGKDQQQQPHPHKPGQTPPMQKSQQLPKQGSPQLHGNGQTGPSNKPAGQQTASKTGTQPEVQHKGEPLKNQPIQQSSPKPGDQQQTRMQQQSPAKTGAQKQGPAKTGVQRSTKVEPEFGKQQQGSPKMGQQQDDSSKVGQEQKGIRTTSQQQPSDKHGPQQQGSKGPGASGMTQAGSSSPGTTKARSQPAAVAKSLCPVCKTTELSKEPPNHKICTQCKMDVCSLCGFSPPDSDAREWLCLTCQIQRAQGSSEPLGPPMKNPTPNKISGPQKQTPSPAEPVKKEMSTPGSPQKIQSKSTKVPEMGEAAKGPEGKKKASPAPVQKMTPEPQRASGSPKPHQTHQTERKQSSATTAPQQQSGGLFSFGGTKTETAKTEESVTGKMFGFGSSIFSSASNLIASAVQDEAKTTPPVSPKMQSTKETKPPSVQKSEQDKKQDQPQQAKVHPAGQAKVEKSLPVTPKTAATSHTAPTAGQSTCPLCNMGLNIGSKDPPNYNTCTECKSIVCNQCGFNPMPNVNEGKEWLCLNCQVKRAAGGIEPQIDTSLGKAFKKTAPVPPAPQKTNAPGSPQRKVSTSAAQPAKAKEPDSQKAVSPTPGQTIPKTQPQQMSQTAEKQENIPKAAQQESGGFFAFGGSKAQPDAAKPVESVTGKMFGFGSSIFSSASTLITSAVQDEPKSTPPVSPKMSAAKDSKPPTPKSPLPVKKLQEEKKTEAKGPPSVQPKADRPSSEPPKKTSASPIVSKAGQSTCPLCKLELNVGSKDPPNYSTCTECKNTVCNQCGFNPMPNVKEVKEWLCLNCQMQRALGVSEPPGTPMMKLQASPSKVTAPDSALKKEPPPVDKLQKKDDVTSTESKLKEPSPSNSPQRKPQKPGEQLAKTEDVKGSESQKQASPAFGQKNAQQSQKTGPQKPPDQINQAGIKKSSITSIQGESGGFFGSPPAQPDSAKPPESLGGKMFGFGSSIFSSASTLINSAVQDESKKTPPVSPKMSSASDSKSPTVKKLGQEKTSEQSQKDKGSPSVQPKADKHPAESPKIVSAVPVVSKAGQSTCPICKLELNVGSKDPPNYNTCTECRNTVCNKCGFNPMPNVKEGKVWLCLNCQMQKSAEQPAKPQQSQKTGPQKPPEQKNQTESLGGKMFGIGTSIFSSASTLINSAVQDDSKRTPPVSPKIPASKPSESPFVQKHEQDKKQAHVQQAKTSPLPQAKVEKEPASPAVPKVGQSACPLCKMELNFGSKDPPNYNKCTECKNTVCNQCGFNPMPNVSEVKEWLCLNCQMQRALSTSEPTGPPVKQLHRDAKISPSVLHQKTAVTNQVETKKEQIKSDASSKVETPVPDTLQKERATLGSPQKTRSTAGPPSSKDAKRPESERQPSPTPGEKKPLDIPVPSGPEKPTDHVSQPGLRQSKVTPEKQEESGNSIGLSGPKMVTDASKTTESISGKMFGFGSSIFSSASTLISSAVQEESRTTPPSSRKMSAPAQVSPKMSAVPKSSPKSTPTVSPKMSPAREPRTLPQKPVPEKKPDEFHQSKDDKVPPQLSKVAKVSEMVPNAGQTTCPLCKAELNMGSKHPPNYNTCTECKNTVCNQCGFNPMPIGEIKEWLCLNCQMKRAVGASELPGPPTPKSQISPNKAPLPAAVQLKESSKLTTPQTKDSPGPPVQKETSEAVYPQRKQSTPSLKQASPTPDHKTPQEKVKTGPEKPPDKAPQPGRKLSNATAATQQESGGFFGFAGPKPQPEAAKSAESMSGKMLGISSSIFSSASTLITSAVRDQPKTTPPVSPKMSPAKEPKSPTVKKIEQEKESGQPQQVKGPIQSKAEEIQPPVSQRLEQQTLTEPSQQIKTPPSRQVPSENPKAAAAPQAAARPDQSTCPLCKVKLNTGSKDLPNYNTCTECKSTVCNQCGFNPMPNETGAKEWLCLTCQMQRALGAAQPPSVASVIPQAPAKPEKKDVTSPAEPEKTASSLQQSPQRKLSAAAQPATSETNVKPEVRKQASPVSSQKIPQKPQKTSGPNKSPDQIRQPERKQSNATAASQKESGGFFGFGSGKPQPDAEKQAESVTGKMFGFGTSIFSSASTLITSAVQDQPKTPPVSPKMSPAKEIKSPATQEKKKPEQLQQTQTPPLVSAKVHKAPSEPQKTGETTVKPDKPTCPLCKVGLNMGSNDLPNYNVCTECKKTVCNQCGFNPTPNETEMKEWLCLTCQMQRALTVTKSVQPPPMKPQASPSKVSTPADAQKDASETQKKDVIPTQKAEVLEKNQKESPRPEALPKKTDIVQTPKTVPPANDTLATVSAKTEEEKVSSLPAKDVQAFTASQSEERQLPSQGPPVTTNAETSLKKKSDLPPEENSEKAQAETAQKAADQLITTSDEIQPQQALNKKSHQVVAQEPHLEKIPKQPQLARGPSAEQTLMDKTPLEFAKPEASQTAPKVAHSTCPLCKVELNVDSKNFPNYNTCTECKTTVCNKCGFSPMPNVTEVKEWLCLNCQMQRALGASEPPGLPMIKPQPSPSNEVPASTQKEDKASQKDVPKPDVPQSDLASIPAAKETVSSVNIEPTKKVTPTAASMPDKTISSTITKTDVSQKPSAETPKGQPGTPQQQTPKVQTTSKPAAPPDSKAEKTSPQQPPKAAIPPAKSAPPPVQPAKQESGGFFGLGSPKTQPAAAKSAESVTGKMFGFGSSFLSSASNLITSAVQDEPKTTPPTPRKMSTTTSVTPKTTPPASPKTLPAKDTKPPTVQKTEEKKPEKPQQDKTPSKVQAKVDGAPSELPKVPTDTQGASKADQSICPLCKVKLTVDSTDPPNYNTCTECKTTVCSQCGFNPVPDESEAKEWLCLNCQMQRALGASKTTEPTVVKPQLMPSKVSTLPHSQQKDMPILVQKEKPDVQKEVTQTTQPKKEILKGEAPVLTAVQKIGTAQQDSVEKSQGQARDVAGQPKLVGKPPSRQISQTPKPEVKPGLAKQEAGKLPQPPSKSATQPAKPTPPPAQATKQESGGFFGFGATKPTAPKPAESVTGKMFGFGSSILSSASTLITSAVQEEPKVTPPTPRKMSTTTSVSPKPTPPVSPKMPPAKGKPPVTQTSEPLQQAKPTPSAQDKVEKPLQELEKSKEVLQIAPKEGPSNCPLCKVKLNVGTKDPPNYNTCTQCKNTVCNLCGFNPMPHTAVKEWLCLNCQTQRALSGQLEDSGKMPQPSPPPAKSETQATPATKKAEPKTASTKAEPMPGPAKSQPLPVPIEAVPTVSTLKANVESTPVKTETMATAAPTQIELETTSLPTTEAVSKQPLTTFTVGEVTPKTDAPDTNVTKKVTMENKEEVPKTEISMTELHKSEESKRDISKAEVEAGVAEPLAFPVPDASVVPASPVAAEVAVAEVVPETQTKPDLSVPERIIKMVDADNHTNLTESSKSLQKVKVQPESPERKGVIATDSKEFAVTDKITISTLESQPVSTMSIIGKHEDENKEELSKKRKDSLPTAQDLLGKITTTKLESKPEDHDEEQPHILPISHELNDGIVSDASTDLPILVKEEIKAERRRLSFQAMDESSESELTPSPSPKVQKRRLKVSNISSSSEDIKTESADSSVEDEEFIRRQIMGMGDDEEMSVSEDEKEKNLENVQAIKEIELDNTSVTVKTLSRKGSTDNEDSPARKKALPKTETTTDQSVPETMPRTTFKKAIPVMRQRQSTDEDVESITESVSKGSSSVQASSFTPESSPTSASSLEEDSDSSPSHKKVSGDKQYRKGKHRQPTQPLPTIEDSSEEEKMGAHAQPLSPYKDSSSTEDLKQIVVVDETHRTSGSEYSASIESEPEGVQAVQRGRKPSPTVIPYTPPDPFKEKDSMTKSLKSAEEAYEEIIQKTKSIPGESPPDIEPLYGGMAIEDYLYESLVEEPEIKMSESQEEPKNDTGSDSVKKLRSPEEVYEEMMQKKRELMMIEHEFQQAQNAMDSSASRAPLVTGPTSSAETCVVTIEETSPTEKLDMPLIGIESSSEVSMKKKKRPAPPRPSEPPKRPEVTVVPSTPSGAISFVRPMVPQDPALRKALFPIPDLKITQCSSGEEEDDSLADEYGIGISSDITPSDDSETKEEPCISPPLYETAEMEPICVVCEIPEPKPIPAPISAPELTTTPSPVSPVSPPTSPASPDSSLASNATSSSPFQAQTPLSSDSTPLSTPTPPTSFKTQSPPEISLPATNGAVPSNENSVSSSSPVTVIVTIPDVVSAPSKVQTTTVVQVKTSTVKAATLGLMDMPSIAPVVVQIPDLVSSPSQVPVNIPAISQVSAPSPAPSVVSVHRTALVAAQPVAVSAPTSATVSTSTTLSSCPGPVIVQMPDLVSTTAPISTQPPLPVSALVTTPAQAEAKVVHSVPVQSAIPSVSPVVVPPLAQTAQMPSAASTTIVKKKVPPPPPPRSTSVSLPETNAELPFVKTVEHVIQTTSSMGTTATGQPMQSVVVDIQPRMEVMQSDGGAVPQLVTPNRQGHVVIIVPSVENKALLEQMTKQDISSTGPISCTASAPYGSQVPPHSALDVSSADISSLPTKVSAVQDVSAPPLPPKPIVGAKEADTVEVPISDLSTAPPSTLPKPTVYPKPSVPTPVTIAKAKLPPVSATTSTPSQTTKPPPPIPPKPVSIPAGLVFSHKPGESVKPPPPVAPKAATLPRTKEPPKALSLSLTRPVESKLGATSPKSPVSPRHVKCLQTYVVITLPSEPGSPTEAITVQAPVRRGSIPSTKVSGVRTTPSKQKTPTEAFSAQATVRRASVPTVRHPPPISVASAITEQMTTSEVVVAEVRARTDIVPSVVQPPLPVIDINTLPSAQDTSVQAHTVPIPIKKPFVQQQQSMAPPLSQPKTLSEVIIMPPEPKVFIQPVQATTTEVITIPSVSSGEALVPQAPKPIVPVQPEPVIEVLSTSLQPGVSLDTSVLQDRPAATVLDTQVETDIEMPHKEQDVPTEVIVTEAIPLRSLVPEVSQQIPVEHPLTVVETVTHSKDQELLTGFNNSWTISEPSPVLSIVTEHLPTWQPLLVAEGVSLITKSEVPTEVITPDSAVRIPEIAMVHPLPHPPPVITDVTPTPEVAELMPLTTDAKMITLTTAEVTPSPVLMEVEQIVTHPDIPPVTYIPQVCGGITSSVLAHSVPPLALQPGFEPPAQIITKEPGVIVTSIPLSVIQPQVALGMPVITTEETTHKRRMSISSIVQPPYTTSERFICPAEYEMPTQVVTAEAFAATRRESRTMQQPYPLAQVVNLPAEKDDPNDGYAVQLPYRRESIPEHQPHILTYSSEYEHPLDIITTEEYTRRTSLPTVQDIPQGVSAAPVTITKIQQESIESQEIRGAEKVVSSMSHMYSSSISTSSQPPESLPSLVTQVVTTEVQRTTVSVVHERLPQVPPPSVAITIQPDIAKVQPVPKQNGKVIYPGDVIDLRTMKVGIKMTEQGMDLTPPESCRQSFSSDSSGRQITAVQPEIVNLSAALTPATTLSVVTDSITIVTCTATIASYSNTPAEKPLDLQGPVTSLPLPLTTYKPFEPLAQIVYRPVNTQPIMSAVASTAQDIPINLSFEALVSSGGKQTSAPAVISNGGPVLSLEATGAMDLTNYKPMRAMVTLSGTSPGVVTTVVADDGTPMDLTAGRRSVCCDVIYKLPFTGSCRTQPPVTSQPDDRSGYRPDHYQYDSAGLYGIKGTNGIKASVSETNLTEAGLFSYDPKSDYDYLSGSSDGAIDLTAAKLSSGKALDYTSKATGVYPLMTTAPYSQIPAAGFGVNSALRTSDGIVYSSVAAPVPSTYAITTQPGSIFSTTLTPTSIVHSQPLPHPYGFIPTTDPGQIITFDTGLAKEFLPIALADIITGYPDMYSDATLEAIAASLDALASSPIFPGLDNTKMAQYQMEREFLELEKLKQLCLAEELEWERQEIQRYREQEQLMVQRELEELQALKQQLLLQQEEEHHAHMVAQQETYAQQKEQLQQIQQLQLQLQRQLDEHYGSSGPTGNLLDAKYAGVGDSGQYWPVKDESTNPSAGTHIEESQDLIKLQADQDIGKKIIDSGVQTDDEDSAEKQHVGRRKKNKRNTDSSAQTDDEDQDEWDAPTKARRRSRKHSSDGKQGSKVSSIAIQTVAEISVQTDHSGTIKRPNVQMDTKVEIIKHISAPENSQRGGSLSCQTDSDRRHAPIEVGYSTHLSADVPSKSKAFYTAVSPLSPEKSLGGRRMLTADPTRFSSGPRILKTGQKSLSDPKSLSPSTEDRMGGYYADSYSGRGSPSSTGKKVKRTLPDPPPEDDSLTGRSGYSTNSARRRLARSTTMARAKILQDIDKELDLVERESSKLRKKQAELDEEEKEIDAKLRYLEMGINRRKEALLKEREKRERAYLQGVAEERDYMSDSEVSNIREARGDGLERPRTAPQSEFDQFIPPQTEADSQYNTLTSPYSHYAQYVPQTQTTSHYTQQNLYQQQSLYHQQVSPYPTMSLSHAQAQPGSYQHALLLQQGKQRQTTLSDLEPKITTNYEVIRNQPLLIVPTSTESGYGVAHLGGKYGNLDLRLGLEERSMASSPMSSISADSFYADIDHHNARNYVLIEDIGELTKASTGLSNTGLGSGFNLPDKELSKADRLRRTAEVAEFLGSSRLQSYGKGEDDTMEEPYELKLLKQQIKQEFRRGTEGLEHLTGLGLPQYLPSESNFRHFPKGEKYSIGRLTLEKQAAKQLPAAMLYQKQMKNKKALIDPKAITKFSPIQESRDLEPEYGNYMGSGASSVSSLAARARLLQDEITFGLRKNLSEQQKYLGSSLGANLSGSLNLGQSLGLGSTIRATAHDDGTYPSGTRSRPSSRPSSVYGLDLSIKRDLSSSSLRLKSEGEVLDAAFAPGVARAKPTSLPISQSRGRIPIVAQNSEEESPLSPVGQPMGMARASAGPLPPISADSRDQFGSSHSLPEVQQHMREESRTRGYDRDIAFIMDDLQGAMSDSEAYHLRREDTDWFDKPREGHPQSGSMSDRRQMKLIPYAFPHTRVKLKRDMKDPSVSGNGLGIRVVGGKDIPGSRGEIGAYIAKVIPGGVAEQTGKVVEGMQVLEWNGVPLMGKTYEEVQSIMGQPCAEAELCVRLDLNMLSDPEHPQALEHHVQLKAGGQRSPGVDPKQLAAELQKVSQQQAPGMAGVGVGGLGVLSALERSALLHSGTGSAASSGVPSPGQPASPAISKKQRHKPTEVMKMPHPITGEIQLQINYDRNLGNLIVHVLQARNLAPRDNDGYSDPFVKVYLLPGRGQVMVVQNASADNKRRTKYAQKTMNPEWNQTVIYKNIHLEQLKKKTLEVTVWDYDRSSSNDFLGEVLIDLSNTSQLDNIPRWLPLKEQSESIEHSRAHHAAQGPSGSGSGQGHGQGQGHMSGSGQGHGMGHSLAPGQGDGSHDSPKNSVIKSRSHGIFPDPAKDMQMMPLEKSHSSPGSSKSSSDGQLRSHGPSRSQSKSSVTQAHLEDAGIAIAAAEAAVQQSCLQPRPGHRLSDVSGSVVLSAPSLVGDAYGGLDSEDGAGTGVDSAIFQVPRIGKTISNGTDKNQLETAENEAGKTQVMGEIKVALKKEVKTEGDQLVLEILQCRNITYKFKSPDHLPDLYVKLYVVNVATQKRIIKKKTRICRHDREPSFNETFRFPLNPTGHSIQLFLVSNGGKFMKKTLIGEAYIWLDKVDMRKRVVSWHKLFVSSTQTNP